MNITKQKSGFTLIEIMVVIVIIGLLSTFAYLALGSARLKARDTKRKNDLSTIGRFISLACFKPNAGAGTYDLSDLFAEIILTKPELKNFIKTVPMDPKSGTELKSNYYYIVDNDAKRCLLFANLENEKETITLPALNEPTLNGGTGVFVGSNPGDNDTHIYFQISN